MVKKGLLLALTAVVGWGMTLYHKAYFKREIEVATTNGSIVAVGRGGNIEIRDYKKLSHLLYKVILPKIHGFAQNVLVPMPLYDIDITPAGKIVVLGKGDLNRRRIFIIDNRRAQFLLETDIPFFQVRFITPTRIALMGAKGSLVVIDSKTKKVVWKLNTGLPFPTRMGVNINRSKIVVVGSDGEVKIYRASDGKLLSQFKGVTNREPLAVAYGFHLIGVGAFDGRVAVYDDRKGGRPYYLRRLAKKIYYGNSPALPTAVALWGDKGLAYTYRSRDIYLYTFLGKKGEVLKGDKYPVVKLQFVGAELVSYTPHSISIWR